MTAPRLLCAVLVCALAPLSALAADGKAGFQHTPPAEAPPGEPLVIEGNLSGSVEFDRLLLRVRGPGEDFEDYKLELQYGDLYRVQLPGSRVKAPGLEYYVEGVAASGDRVELFASAGRPVRVLVGGPAEKGKEPKGKEPAPPVEPPPEFPPETLEEVQAQLAKKCRKSRKARECRELVAKEKDLLAQRKKDADEAAARQAAEAKAAKDAKDKDAAARAADEKAERERAEKDRAAKAARDARPDDKAGREPRPDEKSPGAEPPAFGRPAKDDKKPKDRGSEPPRTRSELEEELAIYTAEDTGGVAQRVEEHARHQPHNTTVLTAQDLKRLGVRYVAEALDLVPGLSVSRDVQGNWRVAVRGLRSDAELLVQLNGQRLNHFYDGRALLNLPVDTLDRIEVFRGPASADVGQGNALGLVNLVTRRDEGLRLSATGGLWEAFDGHLSAAKSFGGLTLFADGDVASQYGYRRAVPRDGLDPTGTLRAKSTRDKRFLVNAGAGASYATEGLGKLSASGRLLLENRSALLGLFDTVGNDSQLGWQVFQAQVQWDKPVSDTLRVGARLWFDQQATDRLWQLAPDGYQARAGVAETLFPDGMLEEYRVTARGFGLDGRLDAKLPANNQLVAGLGVALDSLGGFELLTNYVPGTNENTGAMKRPDGLRYPTEDGRGGRGPAADRLGLGLYAYDTWSPHEVIAVQAGLRIDLLQLPTADAAGVWTGKALVPGFGPRLGLTLTPFGSLVLRGSYGRSFRAPTVQEYAETIPNSDSNQGRFVGNPRLEGAYTDSVEAGVEYLQGLGDGRLRIKGVAYFERLTNAIAMVDTTGNLVPYRNRPLGVQAVGAEGEARLELTRRLTAWVNAGWVRAEDLATPAQARLLTDVPQVRLNAGFSLPVGPFLNVDVITRFASERRNNSRSVLELIRRYTLPGYTTVAAQLRTEPLFDRVELLVIGQNVFNFEYADDATRPDRTTAGVPRETVQVFGTVRVEL